MGALLLVTFEEWLKWSGLSALLIICLPFVFGLAGYIYTTIEKMFNSEDKEKDESNGFGCIILMIFAALVLAVAIASTEGRKSSPTKDHFHYYQEPRHTDKIY